MTSYPPTLYLCLKGGLLGSKRKKRLLLLLPLLQKSLTRSKMSKMSRISEMLLRLMLLL